MLTKLVFFTNFVALALAQDIVPPTCYSDGTAPASDCMQFIDAFCTSVGNDAMRLSDNSGRCYNLPNGNRCDFIAFNTYQNNAAPSTTNYRIVLQGVASQCRCGGYSQIKSDAYTFTVDPNAGRCDRNVQPGS